MSSHEMLSSSQVNKWIEFDDSKSRKTKNGELMFLI